MTDFSGDGKEFNPEETEKLSAVSLLTGKTDISSLVFDNKKSKNSQANLKKITVPKTKKATMEKIQTAQEIMLASLEEEVPPAFAAICKRVEIERSILVRMLPGPSWKLRERCLKYKKNLRKNR